MSEPGKSSSVPAHGCIAAEQADVGNAYKTIEERLSEYVVCWQSFHAVRAGQSTQNWRSVGIAYKPPPRFSKFAQKSLSPLLCVNSRTVTYYYKYIFDPSGTNESRHGICFQD